MDRYRMLPSYRYYDIEGTSPLTLDKSVGKPLRDYKIYGNSIQDETPSPDNPVEIQSCGDKSKNLFNEELLVKYSGGVIEKTESGYLVKKYPFNFSSVIATEKLFIDYIKSILKPNVTYTLSRKTANYTGGIDGTIQIRGNNNTEIFVSVTLGLGVKSATFTFTQEQIDSISNVYIYGRADTPILFEYIYLVEGSYTAQTMPAYEPYWEGYKIPIEVGGTVTNIYLDEPLYRIGSYADYIDFKSGKVVRGVTKRVFDGTENWKRNDICIYLNASGVAASTEGFSTHLEFSGSAETVQGSAWFKPVGDIIRVYQKSESMVYETLEDWVTFLKEQYEKGTPVEAIFRIKTPVEQPIDLPPILTHKDTNVISVDTDIQPSNIQIQYYK